MTTPGNAYGNTHVSNSHVVHHDERGRWRLSWGAVFAGLFVALMVQLLLAVLGAAIGLAAWDPGSGKALGIGAGIWALVSMLIAIFMGGGMAGWAAGPWAKGTAMVHGMLVWATMTLMTAWLVTMGLGALAGATFRVVGGVLGTTANAAAQAIPQGSGSDASWNLGDIRGELESLLRQTGNPELRPESLQATAQRAGDQVTRSSANNADAASEIAALFRERADAVSREDVINVLVARTDMSRSEAERVADRAIELRQTAAAKMDTLKQKAAETAEQAASATSTTLWLALVGMLLSLGAAVAGAKWGSGRGEVVKIA